MTPKKILIVAGEPSGDLHASNLVKDLKKLRPELKLFGMGGALMKDAGVEIVSDISGLALIGFTQVILKMSAVKRAFDAVLSRSLSDRPDLAILVDYPGFNLRLAKRLNKMSIPVIYYISPQVWAWGRDRVRIIKKCVRKILVFFKFEEELYKTCGIDAEFVGHPLLDSIRVTADRRATFKRYGLSPEKLTIAFLPGSRASEIKTLAPVMAGAAAIINRRMENVQFITAKHPDIPMDMLERAINTQGVEIRIAQGDTYNVLAASDLAIVASGTATLETAIIGTPLMIVYKVSHLTNALYNIVSKSRFIGLPNIVAGRQIVPELLQYKMTAENIANKAIAILTDPKALARMRLDLNSVKSSLGQPGASLRAAKSILAILR